MKLRISTTRSNFTRLARVATVALLASVSLLVAGCAAEKSDDPIVVLAPKTEVVSFEVIEHSQDGVKFQAELWLNNANDAFLPMRDVSYSVSIDGYKSKQFVDEAHRTIPRNGRQRLTLVGALPGNQASVAGRSFSIRGHVAYEPPGEVRAVLYDSGIPLPITPFSGVGTVVGVNHVD